MTKYIDNSDWISLEIARHKIIRIDLRIDAVFFSHFMKPFIVYVYFL